MRYKKPRRISEKSEHKLYKHLGRMIGDDKMESICDPRQSAQAYIENFVHDATGKHIRLDRVSTAHIKALSEAIWNTLNPKSGPDPWKGETSSGSKPGRSTNLVRHHDEEQLDDK